MLDATYSRCRVQCSGQVSTFNCRNGPLDVLRTAWQLAAFPFPPAVRHPLFAGESNRKQSYAQAVQQRCADENVSVNTSVNAHRHVADAFRDTSASTRCCWNMSAGFYSALAADANATLREVADTCKSLSLQLPTPAMVRLDTDPLQMRTLFLPWVKNVCVCTSLVCSGGHQSWRLPPWSHPCRTTSVRRRQKTSTCHRSRSPCVVVEKVSTRQRENGDGGVDKKNVKSRQTLHKNSSDLLAGYSNNTLKFW